MLRADHDNFWSSIEYHHYCVRAKKMYLSPLDAHITSHLPIPHEDGKKSKLFLLLIKINFVVHTCFEKNNLNIDR